MFIEGDQNPYTLIDLAKNGDKQAFEKLYRIYFTPVFRYIYLRVKDKSEVELLTQDVFIKIYKAIGTFEVKTTSPLSYFFTVARNTIIDYWRKNRHQVSFGKEDLLLQIPDKEDSQDISFEKKELTGTLYKALNKLTTEQREAITMKYWSNVPNKEIAKYMGKTEEAVRQLQSRGIKNLREILIDLNSNE
jgi:RNA polymerase sigma-70 factor, ECF subfamily